MARRTAAILTWLAGLACTPSPDPAASAEELTEQRVAEGCLALLDDTTRVAVETYSLEGMSAEGASLEFDRMASGIERYRVTFYGETGRLRQHFAFRDDTLRCAEERTEHYAAPLSGVVSSSRGAAVSFEGDSIAWLRPLSPADSLAGAQDSLASTATRLAADADSVRRWIRERRAARRTGAG
ncbi:MAG: hypothetical protein KF689_02885 [Gemmatimonadaceae bacterium]|nr:hypothetical protein [Gemmatimonadaceae bacterium]MCW5827583.1 hypothetical protein [Gemmatimonadaceae bacterium]